MEEGYVPHRWTNMSASTASDNEGQRVEHKLVNINHPDIYYGKEHSGSETEDKAMGDKYLFPYTGWFICYKRTVYISFNYVRIRLGF